MDITRILRVLLTIILVVSFIGVTIVAYRQNQDVKAMAYLSDATTSIATKLTSEKLAWNDEEDVLHPFVLDSDKLDNLNYAMIVAGENFVFQVQIIYLKNGSEEVIENFGKSVPSDETTCALSLPATLYRRGLIVPAKLKVISWRG